MTHKRLFNISSVIATAAFISGLLAGCMEKDLYDPNYGKDPVPDPGEYFGFETRGDVKLSVNYDLPGLIALLEVYDEDPMETVDNESVKKEGIEALFKIYTDKNGKYEYSDFRRKYLFVYIKLGSTPMRKTGLERRLGKSGYE